MVKAFKITDSEYTPSELETENPENDSEEEDYSEPLIENDVDLTVGSEYDTEYEDISEIIKPSSLEQASCVAHSLQLVVKDGLAADATAGALICRLNDMITFFSRSNYWTKQLKLKTTGVDIRKHGTTRWNSLLYALEQVTDVSDSFKHVTMFLLTKIIVYVL